MKMRETSGATDKELSVNNNLFLNPERVSMPDIDIDFADERRQEVIDYVKSKYGEDHVSRIITFGTLAAKMCVKDVGRTLGYPHSLTQSIANAIPSTPGIKIDDALEESPDFREMYDMDANTKKIVDIAREIEGTARNMSQHACGVVIAKNPISDNIPEVLLKDAQGNAAYTAAFQKDEVEENGCIKFDFLGLRNMSILYNASKAIGVDYSKIPIFDPYVYASIAKGNTDGIFQIESDGMKDLVKNLFANVGQKYASCETQEDKDELGRECFERLVAAVALYRPGPRDYIPEYLYNMRNSDSIEYDVPQLEPILKSTYGIIAYQEQVQQICRALAGYSYGRADIIRRGMAKKKPEILAKEKNIFLYGNKKAFEAGKDKTFVPGCVANGIPESVAKSIWAKMEKFSEYAFNRSHAAAYAVISARTAWLKYYHPVEFWVATLNSVLGKADKIQKYLYYAQRDSITVLPPDIDKSGIHFTHENGNIRIGLSAIKHLGKSANDIVEERTANGKFKSFEDFLLRCEPGKKTIIAIALSGAADGYGYKRKALSESHSAIARFLKRNEPKDQLEFDFGDDGSLFKILEENNLARDCEFQKQEKLANEYDYIGMYVSEHPLDEYAPIMSSIKSDSVVSIIPDDSEIETMTEYELNKRVKLVGVLKDVESRVTKNGNKMVSGRIEDKTGSIKFTVFAKTLSSPTFNASLLSENAVVIIDGTRKVDDFGCGVVVNAISEATTFAGGFSRVYCLTDKEHFEDLVSVATSCKEGNLAVIIQVNEAPGHSRLVMLDANDGTPVYRRPDATNENCLKVSFSDYYKLREASKQIKLG